MQTYGHKKTDTLMILHCWYVAKRDPFTSCTIYLPDTYGYLLLLCFYLSLPQSLAFHTGKGTDFHQIDIACYKAIGPIRTKVLLEFHTFTGCDQTERFSEKSKTFWLTIFYQADSDTLEAFGKSVRWCFGSFRKINKILFSCLEGKGIWKILWRAVKLLKFLWNFNH